MRSFRAFITESKDVIEQFVKGWRVLGHSDILGEHILKNGSEFTPVSYPHNDDDDPWPTKQCFKNAILAGARHNYKYYVEGYVILPKIPFPIHHAWLSNDGIHAIDPTLNDERNRKYYGIKYDREEATRIMLKKGIAGMLGYRRLAREVHVKTHTRDGHKIVSYTRNKPRG